MSRTDATPAQPSPSEPDDSRGRLIVAWGLVGVPLAYGVYETLVKAGRLFTG